MTVLSEFVRVSPRFAQSANLERDVATADPLEGYVVTARAADVVKRLADRATSASSGGAWSITGPYGTGKSSLALLIDAAFGEAGRRRDAALDLLNAAFPELVDKVLTAHERHGTQQLGFCRGVATANREPITYTILRALHSAVVRRYGRVPAASKFKAASSLQHALADAADNDSRRAGPSPSMLLSVARCLAEQAPLLLVIDEFGKNLETIGTSVDTDSYLLQQLAEAGQGNGVPIFTLTLQHLSFADYFAGEEASVAHREWAKVQGRFEDIPFTDSASETRALIATVFDVDESLRARVDAWAAEQAQAMKRLAIKEFLTPAAVASCFPLHPLAAAVLPELCGRYGQNERTLFSFLAGAETTAVPALLATREVTSPRLPSVGLPEVYDYFVRSSGLSVSPGTYASRWVEIATRLRDTHGLTSTQSDVLKSIAILNLVGTSGTLRASTGVLAQVTRRPQPTLERLEKEGLVVYRGFADEYRVWQGSDLDVGALVEQAAIRLATVPLIEVLNQLDDPAPVIAARHSAEHDTLRVFVCRYATSTEVAEPPDAQDQADGVLLLMLDTTCPCPASNASSKSKPLVAAVPASLGRFERAALNFAAIGQVLEAPEVTADWVARSELGEQLALAEMQFREAFVSTFSAQNSKLFRLTADGAEELPAGRGTAALSAAADIAYGATPRIRNEMINRSEVTSQGGKARRLLLAAMIEHSDKRQLGLSGNGPEVAIYRALLEETGVHRFNTRDASFCFAEPTDSSLLPAWRVVQKEIRRSKHRRVNLNDIVRMLMSPPVGMKAAVVPVILTAALLDKHDEVAIYEHGTFKAILEDDMAERMVKNPGHFEIKHYASATGARRDIIEALAREFGITSRAQKTRVGSVLAVVGYLVGVVRRLDRYSLRTAHLAGSVIKVRDALLTATEPDELLFRQLPQALAIPEMRGAGVYPEQELFVQRLSEAISDLQECSRQLRQDLLALTLQHADRPDRRVISGQALAIEDEVLDPEIRSFVLAIATDTFDDDSEWVSNVATVVTKRSVAEWSDEDRAKFEFEMPLKIAALRRLVALHADRAAVDGTPFDATRVTFTRSDGQEDHLLVGMDDHVREATADRVNWLVGELTTVLGTEARAIEAIVAGLVDRITSKTSDADADITLTLENRCEMASDY